MGRRGAYRWWVLLLAGQMVCTSLAEVVPSLGGDTRAEESGLRAANDAALTTRKDARAITLAIPAPRGQIVDRHGEPFAQSRVAWQPALQYTQFEQADREFIVDWGRKRMDALAGKIDLFSINDEELYAHYRHRRWLPLMLAQPLTKSKMKDLEGSLPSGVIFVPVYQRYYPENSCAAHIIGYPGRVDKLPTGPINFNDPLFELTEGRAGLEKIYDKALTGSPGSRKLLYDENGRKLQEENTPPRAGGTLVTTLDLGWQKQAERVLRGGCRRGAFVVIDVATGDVLVLASRPSFDLNMWVPVITTKNFKALQDDPSAPLHARAFQAMYPPASCFKPVVALAALDKGVVTPTSTVYCPPSLRIGRTTFRNWTKVPEGSINVRRALARSTNTWFYKVGIDTGPGVFLGMARRLGFGEVSGLPLLDETPGFVPSDEWMLRVQKHPFYDGDTANLSIGQGFMSASPLQVAQAMAGIANGGVLPKLRLIKQVQDSRGRVVEASVPEKRNSIGVDETVLSTVRKGMRDVVETGDGTGKSAGLSYTSLCGKTGTAQWVKSKSQRLAWFAGFLPYENPRYAFAVVYEGAPGEGLSGGKNAAPMVRRFFEAVKSDVQEAVAPPKKALAVSEEDLEEDAPSEVQKDLLDLRLEGESREESEETVLQAEPVDEDAVVEDDASDHSQTESHAPEPGERVGEYREDEPDAGQSSDTGTMRALPVDEQGETEEIPFRRQDIENF